MTDKRIKIPKPFLAVVFAAAFILPFMAAVFMAKPLTARAADYAVKYADINVGDYIDGFGGLKWRVIGKDENGLLVRTDRSIGNKQFSAPKAAGYYINESVSLSVGSGYSRTQYGTNYWEQADIKRWLNDSDDGFASCFDNEELSAIATIPQKQLLWWGDVVQDLPDGFRNARVKEPFTPLEHEGSTLWDCNSVPMFMYNYETAHSYMMNDRIFLPDVKMVYDIYEAQELENANGDPYYFVLNETGEDVLSWLRTPSNHFSGGVELYNMNKGANQENLSNVTRRANELLAVVPSLYISKLATFELERISDNGSGEQDGYKVYSFNGMGEAPDEDAEAVAADKAALDWDVIRDENVSQNEVTTSLWLPDFGSSGTEISWICDKPQIISAAGAVTRPTYGSGDADVVLTAVIGRGSASDDIVFALTVKEAPRVAGTQVPNISAQPIGSTVKKGARLTLSFAVTAQENDILSCQWYSNTAESNSGGAAINGATGSDYSPPTDKEGTAYYYCVIINAQNGLSVTSRAAAVTVTGGDGGLSGVLIVGIIMISVTALCYGGFAVWFIIKKRKSGGAL